MIRLRRSPVGLGPIGWMVGGLLLASCATTGEPPVATAPLNGPTAPAADEASAPKAAAGAVPAEGGRARAAEAPPAKEAVAHAKREATESQRPKGVPAAAIRVTDLELRDVTPTSATVLVRSDKPILHYESFALPNPPRLVINIHDAIHALPARVETLAGGPVRRVQSSQYRKGVEQIVRIVLDVPPTPPALPHLPHHIQAAPGALQIVIGDATTKAAGSPPAAADGRHRRGGDRTAPLPGLSKKISLDLRQMDVLAVQKFLSEQGELNIVPSKNLAGRVNLSVKDVTIRDVLDILALTYELAYVVQNGVIHVMTEADYKRLFGESFADQRQVEVLKLQYADANNVAALLGNMKSAVGRVIADVQTRTIVLMDVPEKLGPMIAAARKMDEATQLQTEVFQLKYAKAPDLKAEVEKVLTPKIGGVRVDKRTNTLVVTDLPLHLEEVRRVIGAFDRKTREVVIEAKIIEVRLGDRFQMGVNWEVLFKKLSDLKLMSSFTIRPPLPSSGKLLLGTVGKDDVTAVIELLQALGKTNTLSTPQIAVVENEEAKILVGTKEAFVTSTVTQTAQAATTAEQVTFVDVGLQLKVTPSINADGFVTMKIRPEVSAVSRTLTTSSGNQIPIVDTATAETTVMVKDGITIMIAGLMKDETASETRKVPVLGDIPLFGAAFRSKEKRLVKTELIIFLTPSIISGDESVAGIDPVSDKKRDRENKEYR